MRAGARIRTLVLALALSVVGGVAGGAASRAGDFAEGLAAFDAGDFRAAFSQWHPLAERGVVEAQVAVAGMFLSGSGTPADAGLAAQWYRRAAEAGDAVAQLNLGDLYGRGLGVPRDEVSAYVWFSLAAAQGRRWPARRRDEIARTLTGAQLLEAQARIAKFRRTP